MHVKDILASKDAAGVFTISQTQTIEVAVADLAARRVGALVVSDDGVSVDGILSERDIIRELGRVGVACLDRSVSDLMTSDVSSCSFTDTAESVLETMTNGRFRHMPIVQDGALAGVISIGDVVKARLGEIADEHSAMVDMIRGG